MSAKHPVQPILRRAQRAQPRCYVIPSLPSKNIAIRDLESNRTAKFRSNPPSSTRAKDEAPSVVLVLRGIRDSGPPGRCHSHAAPIGGFPTTLQPKFAIRRKGPHRTFIGGSKRLIFSDSSCLVSMLLQPPFPQSEPSSLVAPEQVPAI